MIRDKATVTVDFGRYGDKLTAAIDIPGPDVETFDPVDLCDEPVIRMLSSKHKDHATYRRVLRRREGFAKELAQALTDHIVKLMSERDTHNGYPIERDNNPDTRSGGVQPPL